MIKIALGVYDTPEITSTIPYSVELIEVSYRALIGFGAP
jgi:hypothetical protein